MADEKLNGAPAANDGERTVTRKTITLRTLTPKVTENPAVAPAVAPTAIPLTKPVKPGENTNTGNIDIVDDTRTRKTIKLKPIAPLRPSVVPTVVRTATPTAAPAPSPAPAPVATPAPAPAPGAAQTEDDEDTAPRRNPVIPRMTVKPAAKPAVEDDGGEKTIRIKRPPRPATTGPAVTAATVSAAPMAGAEAPKVAPAQQIKMPSLQKPQLKASKPAVPPPVTKPVAAVEPPPVESVPSASKPSLAYLIIAAISLICLIYSTMLITVQFVDITWGTEVANEFPAGVLPRAK